MSDFTYVNLILSEYLDTAKDYLKPNDYLLNFSYQWSCLLTETDNQFERLSNKVFPENIADLSEKIPILYYFHMDEGFGFAILHKKQIVSILDIDYLFDVDLPMYLAIEMYGREKGFELWMDDSTEFHELADEKYDYYLAKVFSNMNLENFSLFGVAENDINDLRNVLTAETFKNNMWEMNELLKKLIKIENLEFISWDYVRSDETYYNQER